MPDAARGVFGDRLPLAERYVGWLADAGTIRGLIGPREAPRLWDRHVLNSAVVAEQIDLSHSVADIGSGAGLPGMVLAIARPDLRLTLIEPLLRRATFLQEVVDDLGLDNVAVVRGRAEEVARQPEFSHAFDVVTSRAVAALDKLADWSLPLVRDGGLFLPMKGESAEAELSTVRDALKRRGCNDMQVCRVGTEVVEVPVTLIRMRVSATRLDRASRNRKRGKRD